MRLVCGLFTFGNNTGRTDLRTDGLTDGRTGGRTDTTSYRDATAHLKTVANTRHRRLSGSLPTVSLKLRNLLVYQVNATRPYPFLSARRHASMLTADFSKCESPFNIFPARERGKPVHLMTRLRVTRVFWKALRYLLKLRQTLLNNSSRNIFPFLMPR